MEMVGVLMTDDDIVDTFLSILRSRVCSWICQESYTSRFDDEATVTEFGDEHRVYGYVRGNVDTLSVAENEIPHMEGIPCGAADQYQRKRR
jgi:hypothetical protein